MRDLLKQHGRDAVLYGLLLVSAQAVNRQAGLIGELGPRCTGARQRLVEAMQAAGWPAGWLRAGELLAGVALLMLAGRLVKVYVKHNAAVRLRTAQPAPDQSPGEAGRRWNGLLVYLALVALALPGAALLFDAVGFLEAIYRGCVSLARSVSGDSLTGLAPAVAGLVKGLAGLLGVLLFLLLSGLATARRHGPILRRVEVDGYAWLTERLSWKNWVIGRKVRLLPFLGKAGVHLPDWATNTDANERMCATVTAFDYPDCSNRERTYLSYKTDLEPLGIGPGQVESDRQFVRYLLIADGQSKTLVRRAYLEESPRRTQSKSQRAFGGEYADREQCLMCLRFSIKRGDDGEPEDDSGEDDSQDTNTFERWDKMGLRRLLDWGPGYKLIYRSRSFDVDMDFFGSWPVSRGLALRRRFYVRNADNRIVAKLVERNILKKAWPILDNDWRVDMYDPDLAADEGFGYVLSLATQYLRRACFYDIHACIRTSGRDDAGETA